MFTKKMMSKLMNAAPRQSRLHIVVGNAVHEIKGAALSLFPPRIWLLLGEKTNDMPPLGVHNPRFWFHRKHNQRKGDA